MNKNQIELLAPAGSYEGFEAAIGAGADAVYVGGAAFGARAYARNFSQEELIKAIRIAHIHDKKLYLTVNTLLKNRELQRDLYAYLAPYYEAGLDAVIVQDIGVMRFIQRNFPELPIHASTQMTITGAKGMKFLENLGAARVVAARELDLAELSAMHKESSIEIEAFVHGALCYSYSGQCLMSSVFGGRSGNRGRCAQPCRLSYQTSKEGQRYQGKEELCPLSLKDICTIDLLPEIIEAGVTSLKIEGRMKQPGYTAGVTGMYRKYLDILLEKGKEAYCVEEADRRYLLDIFNRGGSCTGYYEQHNGPSMMAFTNEKKTSGVYPELKRKKEKLEGTLILFPGGPAMLDLSCNGVHVTVSAGEVQYAKNQPMEEARIRQQMEKLGNTEFVWKSLDIQMDESIFVPVKVLNELRREALEQMEEQLSGRYMRALPETEPSVTVREKEKNVSIEKISVYVSCETKEQAEIAAMHPEVQGLYARFDVMKECMSSRLQKEKELYLAMPHMTRGEMPAGYLETAKEWLTEGMKGFLVRNLESYAMLKEQNLQKNCVIDASLYTWNEETIAFWNEEGILRNTVPLELNEKELRHRSSSSSEMQVYGYYPLMVSAQCVRKNLFGCDKSEHRALLKDRYEKVFPSVCYCHPWKLENTGKREYCYNIIYNSIPFGLLKEANQVKALHPAAIRLSFTMESPKETEKILKEFLDVYLHERASSDREFTKGHFKRGAE